LDSTINLTYTIHIAEQVLDFNS